ncbi:hypothetical protein [Rhodococcus sp. As11]|uniref:hypothetical protein n=1 Tax=Rhodococcus sp. As11 TaxID=3029189 RepID=UPI003B7FF358
MPALGAPMVLVTAEGKAITDSGEFASWFAHCGRRVMIVEFESTGDISRILLLVAHMG